MTVGIYGIVHSETGRMYIGSSVNIEKRWSKHVERLEKGTSHSPHLQSAWRKYGRDAFELRILQVTARADVRAVEQIWLDLFKPYLSENGFNCSKTSHGPDAEISRRAQAASVEARKRNGSYTFTDSHRKAIGAAHKGKALSPEHCEKLRAAHAHLAAHDESRRLHLAELAELHRGEQLSIGHRQKLSAAMKGRPGRVWTDDERARVAQTQKNRQFSEEHRAKLKAAWVKRRAQQHVS